MENPLPGYIASTAINSMIVLGTSTVTYIAYPGGRFLQVTQACP
jgi:hypothetical protein